MELDLRLPPNPPAPLVSLHHSSAQERARTGGKASALARLVQAGLLVPEAVVLPVDQELNEPANAALQDWASSFFAGPDQRFLAVRSSVCCEDSEEASFAGQFLTELHVHNPARLLEAVGACRRSFASARARSYAAAARAPSAPSEAVRSDLPGAVLIQRQIEARWSGVCFSADPESGIEQLSVVEAVPGLGESLLSGGAAPYYVRVDRRSGHIVEIREAPGASSPALLTELKELAGEVVALCERVRQTLDGAPLDIEWAWDGQRLWLLQARPITSPTFSLPNRKPLTEPELWFHGNFAETMPGPVPLLAWDSLKACLPTTLYPTSMRQLMQDLKAAPVELIAGRVCWNVSFHFRSGMMPRGMIFLWKLVDERMASAIERLSRDGAIVDTGEISSRQRVDLLFSALRMQAALAVGLFKALRQGEAAMAAMEQAGWRLLAQNASEVPEEFSPRHAWRKAQQLMAGFLPAAAPHLGTFYALFLPPLWSALASRWSGRPIAETLASLDASPSATRKMEFELRALGQRLSALGVPPAERSVQALPPEGRAALQAFLAQYGHRGPREQDLSQPRLCERPELALELALAAGAVPLPSPSAGSHATAAEILQEIGRSGLRGRTRAAFLRWLLAHARRLAPVREDAKHIFWMPILLRLRRLTLRAADELVQRRIIEQREEIFLFSVAEVEEVFVSTGEQTEKKAREQARRRRREMLRWSRLSFSDVLRSDGVPVGFSSASGPGVWTGVPVSPGVYEGPARVVRDFEEARLLQAGEILVTVSVDPGWTVLFPRAGALIMEVGGVLSHGAVVARELRLPAVAGVFGAVRSIRNGQRLRVDGRMGQVSLVAEASGA